MREPYQLDRTDGCTVTGTFVDGKVDGTVTVTWPSGLKRSEATYCANIPVGTHTTWDEDGNVTSVLEYSEGVVVAMNGQPVAEA